MPLHLSFDDSHHLLAESLKYLQIKDGLCLEFGVYKGGTISQMAKARPELTFYGFDSFEGLTEAWIFRRERAFANMQGLPPVPGNVNLVKGYFDETLPGFVEQHSQPLALLHVDSDLYSSAVTIFQLLADRIVEGTVIVFDEYFNYHGWQQGEHLAWMELQQRIDIEFEYIGYTWQKTRRHKSGQQLALRITKRG